MSNPLVPFLLRHGLAGALAGWLFVGALLALDMGRLGTLIFASPDWWLPLGLLLFGVSVTFSSLAMGAGIMSLGQPSGPSRGLSLSKLAGRVAERLLSPARSPEPVRARRA